MLESKQNIGGWVTGVPVVGQVSLGGQIPLNADLAGQVTTNLPALYCSVTLKSFTHWIACGYLHIYLPVRLSLALYGAWHVIHIQDTFVRCLQSENL